MSLKLTEYDVSYATKEYLHQKGYTIVTWNPPGSQGTFTIPNPSKDPEYRGQTGSESPDLIAINHQEILFVEAKDDVKKSFSDIKKLSNMLANSQRKDLLYLICENQMKALGKNIDLKRLKIKYAIAVPFVENLIATNYSEINNIIVYTVKCLIPNWNNKIIDGKLNVNDIYLVEEIIL